MTQHLDQKGDPLGTNAERVRSDLAQVLQLISLPLVIWFVMRFADDPTHVLNPLTGFSVGMFVGFSIDGVFTKSESRFVQIIKADLTIGAILLFTLFAWELAVLPVLQDPWLTVATNPVLAIVLALVSSRIAIVMENPHYARMQGRREADAEMLARQDAQDARILELERALAEEAQIYTGSYAAPDDTEHGNLAHLRRG